MPILVGCGNQILRRCGRGTLQGSQGISLEERDYNSDAFCSEVQCFSGKEVALTETNDQEKIPESCERKFTLRMRASEQRIGT